MTDRAILHVDMDAFYASVEQYDDPRLRGLPVIVGGRNGRGVVAAASYEARVFGVRSAMPVRQALALCPAAVCVTPRMQRYAEISARIFEIFRSYTPLVERVSLDEAYLDVTDSLRLKGEPLSIARQIKHAIRNETGLGASVGIGPNKLIAKIASDLRKPDGLVCITAEQAHEILDPLPVQRLPGLGRKKGESVSAAGLKTIGQLRLAPAAILERLFGDHAASWRNRANGIDHRPVVAEHDEKSVGNERTFAADLTESSQLRAQVVELADKVAARLRSKSLKAGCITLKVRLHDFRTFTRQTTLASPSDDSRLIIATSLKLLEEFHRSRPTMKIRLLGVSSSRFAEVEQADLFTGETSATPKLDLAIDSIRGRFGSASLARASGLTKQSVVKRKPERT
jgi:DNA polymerase-4